jgi:hypothetical protein
MKRLVETQQTKLNDWLKHREQNKMIGFTGTHEAAVSAHQEPTSNSERAMGSVEMTSRC